MRYIYIVIVLLSVGCSPKKYGTVYYANQDAQQLDDFNFSSNDQSVVDSLFSKTSYLITNHEIETTNVEKSVKDKNLTATKNSVINVEGDSTFSEQFPTNSTVYITVNVNNDEKKATETKQNIIPTTDTVQNTAVQKTVNQKKEQTQPTVVKPVTPAPVSGTKVSSDSIRTITSPTQPAVVTPLKQTVVKPVTPAPVSGTKVSSDSIRTITSPTQPTAVTPKVIPVVQKVIVTDTVRNVVYDTVKVMVQDTFINQQVPTKVVSDTVHVIYKTYIDSNVTNPPAENADSTKAFTRVSDSTRLVSRKIVPNVIDADKQAAASDSLLTKKVSDLENALKTEQIRLAAEKARTDQLKKERDNQKTVVADTVYKTISKDRELKKFIFLFETGKQQPTNEQQILEEVARFMKENQDVTILLAGFTDASGSTSSNYELSKRRTDKIKEQLIEKGVDQRLIFTQYFGETYATEQVNLKDRKVECTILKK